MEPHSNAGARPSSCDHPGTDRPLAAILAFLGPVDLVHASRVCRSFHSAALDNAHWFRICKRRWLCPQKRRTGERSDDWVRQFREWHRIGRRPAGKLSSFTSFAYAHSNGVFAHVGVMHTEDSRLPSGWLARPPDLVTLCTRDNGNCDYSAATSVVFLAPSPPFANDETAPSVPPQLIAGHVGSSSGERHVYSVCPLCESAAVAGEPPIANNCQSPACAFPSRCRALRTCCCCRQGDVNPAAEADASSMAPLPAVEAALDERAPAPPHPAQLRVAQYQHFIRLRIVIQNIFCDVPVLIDPAACELKLKSGGVISAQLTATQPALVGGDNGRGDIPAPPLTSSVAASPLLVVNGRFIRDDEEEEEEEEYSGDSNSSTNSTLTWTGSCDEAALAAPATTATLSSASDAHASSSCACAAHAHLRPSESHRDAHVAVTLSGPLGVILNPLASAVFQLAFPIPPPWQLQPHTAAPSTAAVDFLHGMRSSGGCVRPNPVLEPEALEMMQELSVLVQPLGEAVAQQAAAAAEAAGPSRLHPVSSWRLSAGFVGGAAIWDSYKRLGPGVYVRVDPFQRV